MTADSAPDLSSFVRESQGRLLAHVAWFVNLRWYAIGAAAGLTALCGPILGVLPPHAWGPLGACVLVLFAVNLLYRRQRRRAGDPARRLVLQVFADIAVLTAMLHWAGGVTNPLHGIYVFHVVIAAILLPANLSRAVTLACCSSFTLLAGAEFAGVLERHPLVPTLAPLATDPFLVASHLLAFNLVLPSTHALATIVVRRMRSAEERLEKLARDALLELRRLETVVHSAGAGIRLLSRDLVVLWCNKSIEDWFGPEMRAIGRACMSAFGGPVFSCTTCLCQEALLSGRTLRSERRSSGPDGKTRIFEVSSSPVANEDGEVHQIVELIRDVTEERAKEAQLARAGKMAAIGELAGRVAHEVNNPAGVIAMKVRLLQDEAREYCLPEKIHAGLQMIERHVTRISAITRGLLSYSKPSIERKSRQDLNAIIRATLELIGDHVQGQQVRLELDLAPEPLEVVASGNEIQQVLLNLINNAADAMPEGGRLRVSTALADGEARLTVADSGAGIRAESLPHVFDPFFTTKPEGRGTGLGLSISQGIVRDHGGTIEVRSEPGLGSAFTVALPCGPQGVAV